MRILYIHGSTMNNAGTEAYMMNYFRHMDRQRIQIDFVVHGYGKGAYDEEISELGGKIYHVPVKTHNFIKNILCLYRIIKNGNYTIVHSHMDAMSYIPLKIAKICKVPVRIAHSHSTAHMTDKKLKIWLNERAKRKLPSVATHYFACSVMAAEWLFGTDNADKALIIPNAVDVEKYRYSADVRKQMRRSLNLSDKDRVIGHIGRFEYPKNHEYLIKVFRELHIKNPDYKLVIVGGGSLKGEIQNRINESGLNEAVRFVDACSNAGQYYNAFDLFCFPSHFEGLGMVLVEAQCNGLACYASDRVPEESDLTGTVRFLPINDESIEKWVQAINESVHERNVHAVEQVTDRGYSIEKAAMDLQKIYEEICRDM